MCLAIPGRIVELYAENDLQMGKVNFGGIQRTACLHYVNNVAVGDYVLVHVGFAISVIDEEEARRTLDLIKQTGELESELQQA